MGSSTTKLQAKAMEVKNHLGMLLIHLPFNWLQALNFKENIWLVKDACDYKDSEVINVTKWLDLLKYTVQNFSLTIYDGARIYGAKNWIVMFN